MDFLRLPIFDELRDARNVLIGGAGGGFDVFSGLPLYFGLRAAGKNVTLANLSFSKVPVLWERQVTPFLAEVWADSDNGQNYFPEKHLSAWFAARGEQVPIYCFHLVGPKRLAEGYRALVQKHEIDTIILADGGTDSLMRGDEEGLGTPVEDMSSICAVDQIDVPRKMLVCLGFGIDTFHGVCHAHVLEAIAELSRAGGYLGAFSLTAEMPEAQQFVEATEYVLAETAERPSIVLTSILSALEGRFGNFHRVKRTTGSELFINPLMSMYWCFRLEQVARRIQYLDALRDLASYDQVSDVIETHHFSKTNVMRKWRGLPM